MATQLQKTVSARVLEDNSQVFIESFTTTTTITQYVNKQLTLATGVTNQLVDITPLTSVKEIYIESTMQISIRLNLVANPAIICKDVWYLSTDGITAIYLTNASGTTATVKIVLA
jgi:hypothetical protein